MTEVGEAEENWREKSRQTGFCGFDHARTGAIYFTFHKGKIVFRSSKLNINSSFFFVKSAMNCASAGVVETTKTSLPGFPAPILFRFACFCHAFPV